MAETTTSQNPYLGVMPSAERQAAIPQAELLSTRPATPKTGFYADGDMSPYARRKIRMQEDWDKRYEMMIDQQEAARQAAKEQREIEDSLRDRQLQEEDLELKRETRRTAQDIKHRTNQHVSGFLAGLNGGGVDSAGNIIPPLDPELPDYPKRRSQLIRDFPLATKN